MIFRAVTILIMVARHWLPGATKSAGRFPRRGNHGTCVTRRIGYNLVVSSGVGLTIGKFSPAIEIAEQKTSGHPEGRRNVIQKRYRQFGKKLLHISPVNSGPAIARESPGKRHQRRSQKTQNSTGQRPVIDSQAVTDVHL